MWAPFDKALSWPAPLLAFILFLTHLPKLAVSRRLTCNYCYNADKKEDCFFTQRKCEHKQICYVDTSKVTFGAGTERERTSYMFKMGCAYSSICKDGISYGPGPHGYSRIVRQCCCSDRCTEGDGAGKGKYDLCPWAMPNATIVTGNSGGSINHRNGSHWWLAWTAIPATLYYILGITSYCSL